MEGQQDPLVDVVKTFRDQLNYADREHIEDCIDANDDTSIFKGRCICKEGGRHEDKSNKEAY